MRYLMIAAGVLLLTSCSKKVSQDNDMPQITLQQKVIGGAETFAIPQATIFKMNGPYSDKVAVTLNPDGTLMYYPAPSDIMASSAPYDLGDGWWLNRQGISSNSVFTKWTYGEYSKLKSVPSREEIMDAIIPGSGVTEMLQIPVTISEARSNPAACKKYVP